MEICLTGFPANGNPFYLKKLQEEDLDQAVSICDRCVGKNLYPKKMLADVINKQNHYFYLLMTADGKTAGYIYFYLSDVNDLSRHARVSAEEISSVCSKEDALIGNIQSIGVEDSYRGNGIAVSLLEFSLKQLLLLMADTAFIVCWKIGEMVPLRSSLMKLDFLYLKDSHKVWYDVPDLICPYCEGRCKCDAAIYYKPIKRGRAI